VNDNHQMNSTSAVIFAVIGMVMDMLPSALPGMFPRTGADQASTSALWMAFMGAFQAGLGVAYLAKALAVPMVVRFISAPADGFEAARLPARGFTGR